MTRGELLVAVVSRKALHASLAEDAGLLELQEICVTDFGGGVSVFLKPLPHGPLGLAERSGDLGGRPTLSPQQFGRVDFLGSGVHGVRYNECVPSTLCRFAADFTAVTAAKSL